MSQEPSINVVPLEPIAAGESAVRLDAEARQIRQLRERHRFMLGLAVFVVAGAFLLQFNRGGTLRLPGTRTALPTMCGSRLLFGMDCPGCGLTRSFVALAGGDLGESLRYHRLGWLLALAVVGQIPYRLYKLRELRERVVVRSWPVWFGYSLIAALILNWLLKVCGA